VYGAIVFIWIFMALYEVIIGYMSSDILQGTCLPWAASSNYSTSIILIVYALPLVMMLFCYSRIVYKIRRRVIIHTLRVLLTCLCDQLFRFRRGLDGCLA